MADEKKEPQEEQAEKPKPSRNWDKDAEQVADKVEEEVKEETKRVRLGKDMIWVCLSFSVAGAVLLYLVSHVIDWMR